MHVANDAPYTLTGAKLAVAPFIFGSELCDAIEASLLRKWEKENFPPTDTINTSGCITMEVRCHDPPHTTLRLRLDFKRGLEIAQRLYE